MIRNHRSVSALQAAHESPTLSHLAVLTKESSARLKSLERLIPGGILKNIKPGPIEGTTWCLLLDNNAVAAKLRQLTPALQAHLQSKGWEVTSIRLKVQMSSLTR
ncbi:MAG: hypothetical protein U5L73_06115 [Rhodoferax sp.]|uniref:hypothetical protein n=1 Tax=Rhodoferax sp. TaxID=50421 RepID=UPI002ACDE1B6|nr:hypothetical protein [Rhodoferax sp.]MDZ7891318.1 hypothetical protein [Rhodoferax sp.]